MKPEYITDDFLHNFIETSLAEDIGEGDHSTLACIPDNLINRAKLLVKESGIIAGVDLAVKIFSQYDPRLKVKSLKGDGNEVDRGDIVLIVEGPARSILSTERLVLNCMQRMSGIATKTYRLGKLLTGTKTKLLDTRKTTPNFRRIEKWAVRIGGGKNHRTGLFDMIMLKDNHIDMAGGIEEAIIRTKEYLRAKNKNLRIEVETRNINEVREVMKVGGIDIIMLDNFSIADLYEAVSLVGGKYQTEASGGITEDTIKEIARSGVDYISVGALTHSFKSLDLSLKVF